MGNLSWHTFSSIGLLLRKFVNLLNRFFGASILFILTYTLWQYSGKTQKSHFCVRQKNIQERVHELNAKFKEPYVSEIKVSGKNNYDSLAKISSAIRVWFLLPQHFERWLLGKSIENNIFLLLELMAWYLRWINFWAVKADF